MYDPAVGTGGMLTIASDYLFGNNSSAIVEVYGQELNAETWAIARSELMMKGADPDCRWLIENDWLEIIVALPDQMFYNTCISTDVWIVTNRKPADRVGTVTLVDAREMGTKMYKSLGDKRKELTTDAIAQISRLFRDVVEVAGRTLG